jgi:tetratricopeptide (TPR) repeat protein
MSTTTSEADTLQTEALCNFVNQNYDACLAALHKILKEEKRKNDPRVQHNIIMADFFKGGCIEVEKLQQDLKALCKLDTKPKKTAGATTTTAATTLITPEKKTKEISYMCLEYDGHEISLYNEAVICNHARQHLEAVRILHPMFENRDSLSPFLAVRCALLLLNAALAVHHRNPLTDEEITQICTFLDSQEDFMAKHDESLLKDTASYGLCRTPLLQQYQLLTSQLHLVRKEMGPCLLILHSAYNTASPSTSSPSLLSTNSATSFLPTLYFNNLGVVHMWLNKPQLASLYFTKAVESFERNKAQCPYPIADTCPTTGTGLGISRMGSAVSHVLYNIGMCLLLREKFELAFRSFVVATPLLHTFPCLWLKLAQCCVKAHELNIQKEKEAQLSDITTQNSLIQTRQVPTGIAYRLPVRGSTTVTMFHTASPPESAATATGQSMSLTFADKCLRNAHFLLMKQGRVLLTNNGPTLRASKSDGGSSSASPTPPITDTPPESAAASSGHETEEVSHNVTTVATEDIIEALSRDPDYGSLIQAVYVYMSYVALAMNNPSVALYEAKQLLNMPNCSRENKIVVLSYIAEALCWLNKPSEALQILHGVNLQELLADKMIELNKKNAESLFVNLSIVHILQSKFQRAQECVKQFISRSSSNHSILLQIYLDLVQGNREHAYDLLKKHGPTFTAPL